MPAVRQRGDLRDKDDVGRRLLFDVHDLDAVIDRWKAASTSAPNAGLSRAALKGWASTPVRKRA
jgi:hypothetical protein